MAPIGKRKAAESAIAEVKDGMVLGLGTGSTVEIFIELLGGKIATDGIRVMGVPTSFGTAALATDMGILLTTLDEHPALDLAVDGTDEVDRELNLIKGGGAALTREKVIDSAAKRFVVIADSSKLVEKLGAKFPVPIEVLPLARKVVSKRLKLLGGEPKLRDGGDRKDGPCITDNGNFIIDASFGAIADPRALEFELKRIPGIVEVGLFVNLVHTVYLGSEAGVQRIDRRKQ
jgi:ribose 5-phosphate isomerase A